MEATRTALGWWEIEIRRCHQVTGVCAVSLHYRRRLDGRFLKALHNANPVADLSDVLKRLTKERSLIVMVTGEPGEAIVQKVERDDFHLDHHDAVVIATSVYQRLAAQLLPLEHATKLVIDIDAWLRQCCYGTTAARIRRLLTRHKSPTANKEMP